MNLKKAEKGFKERMFDYYGAFVNKNKLIGFILLKQDKNNLWIKHFVVDKKYRKQGIGKELLNKAINITKRKNLILKTEVLKDNHQAYLFFTKNGFREIFFDKENNQYVLQF
jgi:ribosomal protein S18 acetylase RimI-like enzyme